MNFPFGTIVYHVANSQVPGVVIGTSPDGTMSRVVFRDPVGFSGNQGRGLQTDWGCSTHLLYTTSTEADANDLYRLEKLAAVVKAFNAAKKEARKGKKKPKVKKKKSKG